MIVTEEQVPYEQIINEAAAACERDIGQLSQQVEEARLVAIEEQVAHEQAINEAAAELSKVQLESSRVRDGLQTQINDLVSNMDKAEKNSRAQVTRVTRERDALSDQLQEEKNRVEGIRTELNQACQDMIAVNFEAGSRQSGLQAQLESVTEAFKYTFIAFLRTPDLRQRICNIHKRLASQSAAIDHLKSMHQNRLEQALTELSTATDSLHKETAKRRGYKIYLEATSQRTIKDLKRGMEEQKAANDKNSRLLTEATKLQSFTRQHIGLLHEQVSKAKQQVLQAKEETRQGNERACQQTILVQVRHEKELARVQDAANVQQQGSRVEATIHWRKASAGACCAYRYAVRS